jgi:c-di-GMP-binding flagellar brake protein YcgR
MQDNRKFIRFSITLDAVPKRTSWLKPRSRYTVKDISKEGLKIGSKEALNKGDIIELELTAPGQKKTIMAAGQVAWNKKLGESGYDIGLRFKTIKPEEKFELLDLAYNNWVKSQKAAEKILASL